MSIELPPIMKPSGRSPSYASIKNIINIRNMQRHRNPKPQSLDIDPDHSDSDDPKTPRDTTGKGIAAFKPTKIIKASKRKKREQTAFKDQQATLEPHF